jgi:hypothetical protein
MSSLPTSKGRELQGRGEADMLLLSNAIGIQTWGGGEKLEDLEKARNYWCC